MGRWDFAIVGTALGLSATLLAAEVVVRSARPQPRVQVVRDGAEGVSFVPSVDGTVLWHAEAPRVGRPCADAPADVRRVAVVGSSILRGSGVLGPQVWTELATAELAGVACLDNLAEPAATAEQKRAIALAALDDAPDLLVWEVWENDPGHFVRIGDRAYDVASYPLDGGGRPNPFGVPDALNARLFGGSELYTYAVLASSDPTRHTPGAMWQRVLAETLVPVLDRAEAIGTEVWLVYAPRLDRPFAASLAEPYPEYAQVDALAAARGLPVLRLAALLAGEEVADMRVDTCCHYSVAGHARLAEAFTQRLRAGRE
jgi:hypothetical protein